MAHEVMVRSFYTFSITTVLNAMLQWKVITNPKSQIQLLKKSFYLFYLPVLQHPYLSVFFVAGEAQRAEHLHGRHQQQQDYKFNSLHLTPKAGGTSKSACRRWTISLRPTWKHKTAFQDFLFFLRSGTTCTALIKSLCSLLPHPQPYINVDRLYVHIGYVFLHLPDSEVTCGVVRV